MQRDALRPQVDTCEQLDRLLSHVANGDTVILLGDFNSRLRRRAGQGKIVGKWCMQIHGTNHRRRGQRTDAGRRDAGKGQALELARPHPPPGRALCNTASAHKLYQANTGLALWRCPRTTVFTAFSVPSLIVRIPK